MANKYLWYVVILAGLAPFAVALLNGARIATLEYTAKLEFSLFLNQIVAYSTENWFTYILGILLILIGIKHLKTN